MHVCPCIGKVLHEVDLLDLSLQHHALYCLHLDRMQIVETTILHKPSVSISCRNYQIFCQHDKLQWVLLP